MFVAIVNPAQAADLSYRETQSCFEKLRQSLILSDIWLVVVSAGQSNSWTLSGRNNTRGVWWSEGLEISTCWVQDIHIRAKTSWMGHSRCMDMLQQALQRQCGLADSDSTTLSCLSGSRHYWEFRTDAGEYFSASFWCDKRPWNASATPCVFATGGSVFLANLIPKWKKTSRKHRA